MRMQGGIKNTWKVLGLADGETRSLLWCAFPTHPILLAKMEIILQSPSLPFPTIYSTSRERKREIRMVLGIFGSESA